MVRRRFLNFGITATDMENVTNKMIIITIAINTHPSILNIVNSLSGTFGGVGLHDFGQS